MYDFGRQLAPESMALWMDTIRARTPELGISAILDLGCGTGRFSEALARRCDAKVVGLDPSKRMLARAEAKQHDERVRYVAGEALRAFAATAGSRPVLEPIDLLVFRAGT